MNVALVMTELRAAQAMLRAVFYRAASKQRISTTWFLLGWSLLGLAAALLLGKQRAALIAFGALPLAMLALIWWTFLLMGIAPQVFGVSRLQRAAGSMAARFTDGADAAVRVKFQRIGRADFFQCWSPRVAQVFQRLRHRHAEVDVVDDRAAAPW